MDRIFFTILNMSLTGAFVIVAIILARLLLKRAPKIVSYCLWAVAGFRLLFPFSIESIYSLIPFNSTPIPPDIATQAVPRIESGFVAFDYMLNSTLPTAVAEHSANPLQIWTGIGTFVWLAGIATMLAYGIISYIALKRKMRNVPCANGNIYETDKTKSPFVLGIIKPKIYLPLGLAENEREYIILHERTHIRRHDHIIKFAAYFILCLHWFNPLAWVAYILMAVDMELSCDERVLKEINDEGVKKDYSLSLLTLSTNRPKLRSSPLAFSEDGLKARIKNVLKYKKYSRITIIAAAALAIALGIGLALNAVGDGDSDAADDDPGNMAEDNLAVADPLLPDDNPHRIELRPVDGAEISDINLAPVPADTPETIIINGTEFDITETEVSLDSLTVTDADLEQLKYLTNLQFLHFSSHQWPPPDEAPNGGIINLELVSELTTLTRFMINCGFAIENLHDLSPLSRLGRLRQLMILGEKDSGANPISDLSPLENLPMLTTLYIDIPNVSDISPLTRIPTLGHLGLINPQMSDLSILTEAPSLLSLALINPIADDFSFLAEMQRLRSLSIESGQFDDFSVLSELLFFDSLLLVGSPISDISRLGDLTNLRYLVLHSSEISDISALSELTRLRYLDLSHNSISDISSLAGLTRLDYVRLSHNQISDISPLAGLANLESLLISNNDISDLTPLAELSNLQVLDILTNSVSDLTPLAGLSNLTRLFLIGNPIEDVSALLELTNLEYVNLSYRQGFGSVRDLRAAFPDARIDPAYWWVED